MFQFIVSLSYYSCYKFHDLWLYETQRPNFDSNGLFFSCQSWRKWFDCPNNPRLIQHTRGQGLDHWGSVICYRIQLKSVSFIYSICVQYIKNMQWFMKHGETLNTGQLTRWCSEWRIKGHWTPLCGRDTACVWNMHNCFCWKSPLTEPRFLDLWQTQDFSRSCHLRPGNE